MKLSIIIVSYNSKDFLLRCLESLKELGIDNEVFVVDNNSSDGSQEMIRLNYPWVRLIENRKNLGFAKANNQALRLASGRYILLLNPDTLVPQGTIEELLEFMNSHEEIAVVTPRVEFPDGRFEPACHRGFPTPWASFCYYSGLERLFKKSRIFGKYHLTWCRIDEPHEIDAPSGCFFLVRSSVLEKVGFFDEDYFLYGEDVDLAYRIKKNGFKVFFYPKVKIIHYKGISSGVKKNTSKLSGANNETKRMAIHSFYQAMRIFYKKHWATNYPFIVNWLVYLGVWLFEWKSRLFKKV